MNFQTIKRSRPVERLVVGQATQDGAGVKLTRVLTQDLQRRLDPFLMLDNFGSDDPEDYGKGFPDHPHRGFETVTYMIAGRMRHKDSAGNEGLLSNGGVQWMTAGRGVIHSEMPEQEQGVMEGFQLWLNLPARDKMCPPWYRDIQSSEIPEFESDGGVRVRVIAGTATSDQGPVAGAMQRDGTEPLYLDILMPPGSVFSQSLAPGHNAFVYAYRESARIEGSDVPLQHMAILGNASDADGVTLEAPASNGADARLLLLAGRPLGEPIAQYGPFVMNTRHELMTAVEDFQSGRLA